MENDFEEERRAQVPPDLPDDYEDEDQGDEVPPYSLTDDVMALLEDGKTYAEAELAYQKSRAGFAANRVKYAVAYGLAAFGVFHLALIAIAVGLVIALAPIIGAWGATAVIGGLLLLSGLLLLRRLKAKIDDIRDAFSSGDSE